MRFLKNLFRVEPAVDWKQVNETLEPKISGLQRPAVQLMKTERQTNSKLGGLPHADDSGFSWPCSSNNKPMAFLAQLDLAEIATAHQFDWLTSQGRLLFFYDVEQEPWGYDPADRGKWQVIYQSGHSHEITYPTALNDDFRYDSIYLQPTIVQRYPGSEDTVLENIDLNDEEWDAYSELTGSVDSPVHQVGGFPVVVQGSYMELESQLASNGVYLGGSDGWESEEATRLKDGARDWRLLLQIDSDDDLGVMWGDCGTIYFWVQEQRARENQFENSWVILQCS